ncbi:peptidoglycan-binding protein [Spirilliplanes yamanashiensis]|uniref:Peptidoglycan-binding protein n=1 Tax=Spirilliplanes yamanashiensis TaxID=42233 RepID=A0A8J3Y515_9ACTN|nr:peptidoglycan-binding protein [Spirilliplanes yamanashiensis]MDP9819566.1 peptidoglycan hydrolase-like protein with peptidoglycan-binding domain [Spirilliplanes yamanashiensis]GIJ01612.1 peptidoglycan-binding protein [Spirilliplanes yamanashiensis]
MRPRRRAAVGAAAAVVTLASAGAAAWAIDSGPGGTPPATGPAATTTVRTGTLADTATVDGELGHGDPVPLVTTATGTVTWLPAAGRTVRRGGTLFRADDDPVVLLYGTLPLYRELRPGLSGADVRQLERNLRALGYDGFTADDDYTAATARAVREWQDDLGRPGTGRVSAAWAAVAPGEIRVASLTARLGGPAGGEVLRHTGTAPVVTVDADASDVAWAEPGVAVTVTLPGGEDVAGTVTAVGAEAEKGADGAATLPVTIALKRTVAVRSGPVEVEYVGERRENVLTVPVAALVALAEGGYGLELAGGGHVAVEVGLVAGGTAEVRGAGVADGLTVGMPS